MLVYNRIDSCVYITVELRLFQTLRRSAGSINAMAVIILYYYEPWILLKTGFIKCLRLCPDIRRFILAWNYLDKNILHFWYDLPITQKHKLPSDTYNLTAITGPQPSCRHTRGPRQACWEGKHRYRRMAICMTWRSPFQQAALIRTCVGTPPRRRSLCARSEEIGRQTPAHCIA